MNDPIKIIKDSLERGSQYMWKRPTVKVHPWNPQQELFQELHHILTPNCSGDALRSMPLGGEFICECGYCHPESDDGVTALDMPREVAAALPDLEIECIEVYSIQDFVFLHDKLCDDAMFEVESAGDFDVLECKVCGSFFNSLSRNQHLDIRSGAVKPHLR